MKPKKRPVLNVNKPGYPSARNAKIQRRSFLALIGGAASTALLASCRQLENGDWVSEDTDGALPDNSSNNNNNNNKTNGRIDTDEHIDTDTDTHDTGYNSTDDIDGDISMPELYSLRLPATGGHTVYLWDSSYLSYAISTQHENNWFSEYARGNTSEIFEAIDNFLNRNVAADDLVDNNDIEYVSSSIQEILERLFRNAENDNPLFVLVRLEVVRLQIDDQIDGGIMAPDAGPTWPPIPDPDGGVDAG